VVFGLFGSKVERLKKATRQRYGQHEPRKDAMLRLLQMGDLEAYRAVLSRFTVNCDSPHWDEKEKTWLAQRLSERHGDEELLQALSELLMSSDRLNQVLAVARELMDKETYTEQVRAAFKKRLGDHRAADACVELTAALGDLGGEVALRAGLDALGDRSDEVILAGIALLQKTPGEGVAEGLYDLAFDPLQMPRVVRCAGHAIVALELSDPLGREELPSSLSEDFSLLGGRLLPRA
jgi:AcrR family transcriptional regulator